MKLLIDEGLSRVAASGIRADGIEAIHVADIGFVATPNGGLRFS